MNAELLIFNVVITVYWQPLFMFIQPHLDAVTATASMVSKVTAEPYSKSPFNVTPSVPAAVGVAQPGAAYNQNAMIIKSIVSMIRKYTSFDFDHFLFPNMLTAAAPNSVVAPAVEPSACTSACTFTLFFMLFVYYRSNKAQRCVFY